jgi:hypothetical protein
VARGAGGAASPSLSAMGKAVSAAVEEGPPTGRPGGAGFAVVVPLLAIDVTGTAGQPQGSGS